MIRIISHNDLDGYGCTILAKKFFGVENVKARNITNLPEDKMNELFEEEMKTWYDYDMIFITDLSLPESVMKRIAIHNNDRMEALRKDSESAIKPYVVYYCDHHKTSDRLKDLPEISSEWAKIRSNDRSEVDYPDCGTSLFYNLIYDLVSYGRFTGELDGIEYNLPKWDSFTFDYVAAFVELVRLWDTFNWVEWAEAQQEYAKVLSTEAVNLNRLGKTAGFPYIESMVLNAKVSDVQYTKLLNTHMISNIIPPTIQEFMDIISKKNLDSVTRRISDEGIPVYIYGDSEEDCRIDSDLRHPDVEREFVYNALLLINCDDISTAREVAFEKLNYRILITWNPVMGSISLRVADDCDFDASKFAICRGGGGHKKAAGIKYNTLINHYEMNDNEPELYLTYLQLKDLLFSRI